MTNKNMKRWVKYSALSLVTAILGIVAVACCTNVGSYLHEWWRWSAVVASTDTTFYLDYDSIQSEGHRVTFFLMGVPNTTSLVNGRYSIHTITLDCSTFVEVAREQDWYGQDGEIRHSASNTPEQIKFHTIGDAWSGAACSKVHQ